MPRSNDTKVWNEDLVVALRARQELARQRYSIQQYLWRDGAATIEELRQDVYQFKNNGRIVGLPKTLTKVVDEECRAIITGTKPVLPDQYVPTSTQERNLKSQQHPSELPAASNPYLQDPYLKRIKMRGGAYAILLAFHFSETKTMTKAQLSTAAQEHCDEEMEPNFHAGRSYGAWSSKHTLISHGLIQESRTTQMGPKGRVCNGVFIYSLTQNGTIFIEALLKKFPHIESAHSTHVTLDNKALNAPSRSCQTLKDNFAVMSLASKTIAIRNQQPTTTQTVKRELRQKDMDEQVKPTSLEDPLILSDSDDSYHELEPVRTETMKRVSKQDWILDSDSDSHDESDQSCTSSSDEVPAKKNVKRTSIQSSATGKQVTVVGSEESSDLLSLSEFSTQISISSPDVLKSRENLLPPNRNLQQTSDHNKHLVRLPILTIIIDNRERNRNATPRLMRMELTRHFVQPSGCLRQIWPRTMAPGVVEEDQLNYGDFRFRVRRDAYSSRVIPVSVERKRIGDLVQRSYRADHWKQLQRMRDCCEHAILLVEGNATKTSRFATNEGHIMEQTWNPDHHSIDDECAFYRFLGRAVLASTAVKFLQTRDEQSSYRAIGAVGLVAANLTWKKDAPSSVPSSKVEIQNLCRKLRNRGIPSPIADRVSEELGSSLQLNKIYSLCERSCRPRALMPIIARSCSSIIGNEKSRTYLEYGTVEGWSLAIDSAWHSTLPNPDEAVPIFEENKIFANDRAHLLSSLHMGKSAERAIQESNQVNGRSSSLSKTVPKRIVLVESLPPLAQILPSNVGNETFYNSVVVEDNPFGLCLPCIAMRTIYGEYQSRNLVLCILEGTSLVRRIQVLFLDHPPPHEAVEVAKAVALQINLECTSFLLRLPNDHRVLIIRGLGPALDAAAKIEGYRSECKVLTDLVIAELMMRHNIVVIQAIRLLNDMEMIVREFAMACFYYQLITCRVR